MLNQWLDPFVALLIPRDCWVCGALSVDATNLCAPCAAALKPLGLRLTVGPPVSGVRALGPYDGPIGLLVRRAKYANDPVVARRLGQWMAECTPFEVDLVTHVPCRWRRALDRGFDPVAVMAQTVAGRIGRPHRALLRRLDSGSQVGRTRSQRRALDPDAFAVHRYKVAPRVLLIDDVITTGATVRVCAAQLRAAGARRVMVVAAAHQTSKNLSVFAKKS
jgi:predicted amidophosphoribosyltransferase